MRRRAAVALVTALVVAAAAAAATKELRISLRIEPELKLDGSEKIYIGPVLIEQRGGSQTSSTDLAASREFDDYLRKVLRRKTRLDVLPPLDNLELPTDDPIELATMKQFWVDLGAATDADFIVAASIDVKVLDRAGYNTEEYVSPTDGKTYFRQVLVEETGFNFDILMTVHDANTGALVLSEQITDFKERSDRKLRETDDMFAELYNLDNRLLGVFVPRSVVAKRTLYTD